MNTGRRASARDLALAASTLALLATQAGLVGFASGREREAPGSVGRIAPGGEAGEPMILTGRVLRGDRGVPGAFVYAFHTDAEGYYSVNRGMDNRHPRLHGTVRTDALGRYRFQTIRPAAYATGGAEPHVHFEVWGRGIKRQPMMLTFRPAGSASADAARLAGAGSRDGTERPLVRDREGTWHCVRDLRVW